MLDLNIGAEFSVDSVSCDNETDRKTIYNTVDAGSVTSTTVPADDHDSNSSSSGNSIPTLNFSILQEKVVEIDDRANNGVISNRYESQLFPVSALSSTPVADMTKHWLNLSVPEASGAGGVGLGIFTAQLPLNNRMQQQGVKKSRRGPRPRSSQYRGVTFYRRTGRWESHIWDCGKQVYLGGFDTAYAAARAYDRAAVKFRGIDADINFNISDYEEDMKQMKNLTKEEFVQILRRQHTGSQGSSKYRGITLHKYGRWEARMGPFLEETAYGKATNVRNPGQTIACFEPSSYKRNINMISSDGGIVDLNLGISVASDDPHRNDIAPDGKRVEERAAVTSAEGIPSPGCSNRSLEVPSHGVRPLSSAASSGFSSTNTPNSNSLM